MQAKLINKLINRNVTRNHVIPLSFVIGLSTYAVLAWCPDIWYFLRMFYIDVSTSKTLNCATSELVEG